LDQSYENKEVFTQSQGGVEYPTINKRKAICIGHILHWNCLLKHVTEERKREGCDRKMRVKT
jgi:hypothetical protein